MPKSVLLCPPTYFDVRDRKNPYMNQPIDRAKALGQWEAMRTTFQRCGLEVEIIDPVKNLEDMVFAANQVFVGYHARIGKFIVPSEMRYLSRQREVPYYVDWFARRGYSIISLDLAGECLEGHGDLLWHPDRSRIWAGYGFRSTRKAIDSFAERMRDLGFEVTPLQLMDEHCYHLDTCLCPLNADAALVYPGAFSPEAWECLRKGWRRLHEIDREEAVQFVCNSVVANGNYIGPYLNMKLEQVLQSEGLNPVLVDTSEFQKSGGSVFCMKAFLD